MAALHEKTESTAMLLSCE